MRPWFWVLLLFGYPLADSLLTEWYLRVSVGAHAHFLGQNLYNFKLQTVVRLEAILTQLVFEHSLRVRLKAESSEDDKKSNLVGKINNLVTTDLATINEARNCIVLTSEIPILFVLYGAFLYTILGWRCVLCSELQYSL